MPVEINNAEALLALPTQTLFTRERMIDGYNNDTAFKLYVKYDMNHYSYVGLRLRDDLFLRLQAAPVVSPDDFYIYQMSRSSMALRQFRFTIIRYGLNGVVHRAL